jgi:hypothetical protein
MTRRRLDYPYAVIGLVAETLGCTCCYGLALVGSGLSAMGTDAGNDSRFYAIFWLARLVKIASVACPVLGWFALWAGRRHSWIIGAVPIMLTAMLLVCLI